MQLTIYRRSYPVADSPVALSFIPHTTTQKHTFTAGGRVYDAKCRELKVTVPDDAKMDFHTNLLVWRDGKTISRFTAQQVHDLAAASENGFGMA